MPQLDTLLRDLGIGVRSSVPPGLEIEAVSEDSRRCSPGTLFVAIAGAAADGRAFVGDAAARGATAALVSGADGLVENFPVIEVENPRRALALLAHRLAGDPSHSMKIVAVTGTNGKTTVTYLLEAIFRAAGIEPGVLGTIAYRWKGHEEAAANTTPSPTVIAAALARMKSEGVGAVAMEISSHALDQHRADGVHLSAAGFTNLTQDHLDYHPTMEAYIRAKQRLFTELLPESKDARAVINIDDPVGRQYAVDVAEIDPARLLRYSLHHPEAELLATKIRFHTRGMDIHTLAYGEPLVLETPMHGFFNAVNCITAAGLALAAGISREAIQAGLATMPGAPGRFEFVQAGQPFPIIVDYAHTPDALLQLLLNARGFAHKRLIAVFGCGGDRDPGKRPLMGEAAARLADEIIVTNDNPRTEEPAQIAEAILDGIKETIMHGGVHWRVELDRRRAIELAINMAGPRDAVVIAGKGHEDYQIHGTKKTHFDDREEARRAVAMRRQADTV